MTFLYNLQWNLSALSLDKLSLVLHEYPSLRHPLKKLDITSMCCIGHHWVANTTTIARIVLILYLRKNVSQNWLLASHSFVCFLLYFPVSKPFKKLDFTSMWCSGHHWVANNTTIARTILILYMRKNKPQNRLIVSHSFVCFLLYSLVGIMLFHFFEHAPSHIDNGLII